MPNYKLTKRACYFAYLAMSSVFCLPALLFTTFRETFGISYTLLGTLVLVNFCTQLAIDLVFSFFSRFFNIKLTVRVMPLLTALGLTVYALVPTFFSDFAYGGLVIGTVIFSVASGLCEVLLSPTVAALPSKTPERDMSMLHSLYAWGVLLVVGVSTLFLRLFGTERWAFLVLFWAALPIVSSVLFCLSPMPDMELSHPEGGKTAGKRHFAMTLCVLCIFLGSAAENSMTNWISAYIESALGISKALGDIPGLALFALLLGVTRTLYAKYGKNIVRFLLVSMSGAAVCYLVVGFSQSAVLSMIACVLTGICTSMLWPGSLIMMEENLPGMGVAAYALMAAGGDFGASVAPQLLGFVVDTVSASSLATELALKLSLTPEQVGMKAGMLVASVFPILGTLLLVYICRYFKKNKTAVA